MVGTRSWPCFGNGIVSFVSGVRNILRHKSWVMTGNVLSIWVIVIVIHIESRSWMNCVSVWKEVQILKVSITWNYNLFIMNIKQCINLQSMLISYIGIFARPWIKFKSVMKKGGCIGQASKDSQFTKIRALSIKNLIRVFVF